MDYFSKKKNFYFFALRASQIHESKKSTIMMDTASTAPKSHHHPMYDVQNGWVKKKENIEYEGEKVE